SMTTSASPPTKASEERAAPGPTRGSSPYVCQNCASAKPCSPTARMVRAEAARPLAPPAPRRSCQSQRTKAPMYETKAAKWITGSRAEGWSRVSSRHLPVEHQRKAGSHGLGRLHGQDPDGRRALVEAHDLKPGRLPSEAARTVRRETHELVAYGEAVRPPAVDEGEITGKVDRLHRLEGEEGRTGPRVGIGRVYAGPERKGPREREVLPHAHGI